MTGEGPQGPLWKQEHPTFLHPPACNSLGRHQKHTEIDDGWGDNDFVVQYGVLRIIPGTLRAPESGVQKNNMVDTKKKLTFV